MYIPDYAPDFAVHEGKLVPMEVIHNGIKVDTYMVKFLIPAGALIQAPPDVIRLTGMKVLEIIMVNDDRMIAST